MSEISEAALGRILAASPSVETIDLSVGEPDFPTPAAIVDSGIRALRAGETKYTPRIGYTSLREAIVEKITRRNGYSPALDDVIVTAGASAGTCIAIASACGAGDAILIPDPTWPNYEMFAERIGIECRRYRCSLSTPPDVSELESLVDSRTKLIVVNSPGNPTGYVIASPQMAAIVAFAERRGLLILSDEAYEGIVFEGDLVSPAAIGARDRTFSCYTLSKTYAMTGWRVGYLVVPPALRSVALQLQATMTGCAPAMAQRAAEQALTGPQDIVANMRSAFRRRRDLAVDALAATDLLDGIPGGGFYLWLNVLRSGKSGLDFTRWLLEERDVLVSAGEVYSTRGDAHVRVSYATDEGSLLRGLERLRDGVDELAEC